MTTYTEYTVRLVRTPLENYGLYFKPLSDDTRPAKVVGYHGEEGRFFCDTPNQVNTPLESYPYFYEWQIAVIANSIACPFRDGWQNSWSAQRLQNYCSELESNGAYDRFLHALIAAYYKQLERNIDRNTVTSYQVTDRWLRLLDNHYMRTKIARQRLASYDAHLPRED